MERKGIHCKTNRGSSRADQLYKIDQSVGRNSQGVLTVARLVSDSDIGGVGFESAHDRGVMPPFKTQFLRQAASDQTSVTMACEAVPPVCVLWHFEHKCDLASREVAGPEMF